MTDQLSCAVRRRPAVLGAAVTQLVTHGRRPINSASCSPSHLNHARSCVAFPRPGLIDARKALVRALQVGLTEGGDPVTATRVWASRGVLATPAAVEILAATIPALDSEVEAVDGDGLVERIAMVEEVFPRLGETVETIGETLNELGTKAEGMGREITLLNSTGQPASARLAALHRFASILQEPADELTRLVGSFVEDMGQIDGSVNGILEFLTQNPDARQNVDSQDFLKGLFDLDRAS